MLLVILRSFSKIRNVLSFLTFFLLNDVEKFTFVNLLMVELLLHNSTQVLIIPFVLKGPQPEVSFGEAWDHAVGRGILMVNS